VAKGEDAVRIALDEKPSLILMDIRLAGEMDGIEAAEKIHCHLNIPIVFMTGFTTNNVKERAHAIKAIDFLEKPLNLNKIRLILKNL